MLVQKLADLINASHEVIEMQFGKFDFAFATEPGKVIFKVTNNDGDTLDVSTDNTENLMRLAHVISHRTKIEYPDDGISTYIAVTNIYQALKIAIDIGPNVETDKEMSKLIKALRNQDAPIHIHGQKYKSTIQFVNSLVVVKVTKPNEYHDTARFSRIDGVDAIINCIVMQHQQLNSGEEPNREELRETILTIGDNDGKHVL